MDQETNLPVLGGFLMHAGNKDLIQVWSDSQEGTIMGGDVNAGKFFAEQKAYVEYKFKLDGWLPTWSGTELTCYFHPELELEGEISDDSRSKSKHKLKGKTFEERTKNLAKFEGKLFTSSVMLGTLTTKEAELKEGAFGLFSQEQLDVPGITQFNLSHLEQYHLMVQSKK